MTTTAARPEQAPPGDDFEVQPSRASRKEAAPAKAKPGKTRPVKTPRAAKPAKPARPAKPTRTAKSATPKPKGAKPAPRTFTWPDPEKPSMILLPPKIAGARRTRRSMRRAGLMSLVMLNITLAVYLPVLIGTENARDDLSKHVALGEAYKATLAQNAPVQDYYTGFIARKQLTSLAMDGDLNFSKVFQSIAKTNTVGAKLTDVTTLAASATPPSGDPFGVTSPLGYIEIKGVAPSERAVANYVDALNKEGSVLSDAYSTGVVVAEEGYEFTIAVGYTDQAYSFKGVPFAPTEEEAAFAARVQEAIAQEAAEQAAVAAAKEATQ